MNITKVCGVSQILFLTSVIGIPEDIKCTVQKLIDRFIKRKRKIKNEILESDYDKGGLKCVNLTKQIQSIRAVWVKRLISCKGSTWTAIPWHYLQVDVLESCALFSKTFSGIHLQTF